MDTVPIGKIVTFGVDKELKECAWVRGKMPEVGTVLYATTPPLNEAIKLLEKIKSCFLSDEDFGIGFTNEPYISTETFHEICDFIFNHKGS